MDRQSNLNKLVLLGISKVSASPVFKIFVGFEVFCVRVCVWEASFQNLLLLPIENFN